MLLSEDTFSPASFFRICLFPACCCCFTVDPSLSSPLFLPPWYLLKTSIYFFFRNLALCSLLVSLLTLPALVIVLVKRSSLAHTLPPRPRRLTSSLWIALLPLVPVICYLLVNKDILSLLDVVVLLAACLGISFVLVVAIPALLSRYSPTRLLASVAGAFAFTIMNMASVSGLLHWLEKGNIKTQLFLFALALVITWLLLGLRNTKDLAFVVVAFLLGSAAIQLLTESYPATPAAYNESRLAELVAGRQPSRTPNIYLLVYDAYTPNETMLFYGIDNSDQEDFLVEQGFTLYPHTYSVGAATLSSMNRVLNVAVDADDWQSRTGVSGGGVIDELLRSLDYRVYGIFGYDYMFRGPLGSQYDYSIPRHSIPSYQLLLAGIWMGEFRFDIGFQTLDHEEYVQAKREVFAAPGEGPLFVYTHSAIPGHSQNSGVCLPNETELHAERLREANAEMRQDIAGIITNDPDAIIIVTGDHGPYLTKNCLILDEYDPAEITRADIQDRFGAFLAVRWPADDYSEFDQITVLQDIFPAIFAWMYRDPALLEARIEPATLDTGVISTVVVKHGIISGGADDGQPLFLSGE